MKTNKVVFMGSKEIGLACLDHLIASQLKLDFEIAGVLSNNRTLGVQEGSISESAQKNGIPILKDLDEFIKLPEVDIVISVQYHQIFKKIHLQKASQHNINLHMAPLPEYRGCNQFSFAIINGDTEFGTSLHIIDEGIDSGPLIAEKRFKIPEYCFVDQLYELTFRESVLLFENTLPALISGDFKTIPQNKTPKKRSEIHYRKEIEEIKQIDPNWPKEKILSHVRATAMPSFSPPLMKMGNKTIKFLVEDA